jgi:hypothetical protein
MERVFSVTDTCEKFAEGEISDAVGVEQCAPYGDVFCFCV